MKQLLRNLKLPLIDAQDAAPQPLLAVGLSKAQADKLWDQLRLAWARLVNRDFERFDLRLDDAPQVGPEGRAVSTTSSPRPACLSALRPGAGEDAVVILQNIPFATMAAHLETIAALGGASGHLLAFQVFAVAVEKVEVPATVQLLRVGQVLSAEEALAAIGPVLPGDGAMTSLARQRQQARAPAKAR